MLCRFRAAPWFSVLALPLAASLLAGCSPADHPAPKASVDQQEALTQASRALSDRYQTLLLAQLTEAMKAGGPTAAIEVCSSAAPAIAEQLSAESGAQVSRTALRVRNPSAAPSAAEYQRLKQMEKTPIDANGKPVELTWQEQKAEAEGQDYGDQPGFHYMRAIPLKAPCATCHGQTIAPDVQAAIQARYPQDQATGFRDGDLRGAFRVWWPNKP